MAQPLFSIESFFPTEEFTSDASQHNKLQLAASSLIGAILTSRSPASAISIIGALGSHVCATCV